MMRKGVAMYIDHIRVYQSKDDSAHVGNPHTMGCDPPEYPTREYIKGHEYRYMRQPPFVHEDKHPLRDVKAGGGKCEVDNDCGCNITITASDSSGPFEAEQQSDGDETTSKCSSGRGQCVINGAAARFFGQGPTRICKCNEGFTGPNCLAIDHIDDSPSAYAMKLEKSLLANVPKVLLTPFTLVLVVVFIISFIVSLVAININKRREDKDPVVNSLPRESQRLVTGRSI